MAKEPKEQGAPKDGNLEQEVRIYSLATTANECIIFLEEVNGNRLLPIWIGLSEGQAIAIRFSGIVLPRPLTHDLLLAMAKMLGWSVEKVVVHDLRENTFYANIHLKKAGQNTVIDARPSDAIAVAVRAGCTIFVQERVFQRCQVLNKPISENEVEQFKKQLKDIRPEDIFKELKDKEKQGPVKKEGQEEKGEKEKQGPVEKEAPEEKGEDDE